MGCYLEPDFKEKQQVYTPFVYAGQREKTSVYYLNLVSCVKYEYGFLWIFFSLFMVLMCLFTEKIDSSILAWIMVLSVIFNILT